MKQQDIHFHRYKSLNNSWNFNPTNTWPIAHVLTPNMSLVPFKARYRKSWGVQARMKRAARMQEVRSAQRALIREGIRSIPIKRFSKLEKKFLDTTFASSNLTAAWAFYEDATMLCLNGTATGNTESTRDGRQIQAKQLVIRGSIYMPSAKAQTTPAGGNVVRVMVVRDKQANGAQGTAANIMTNDIEGFRNLDYVQRYDTLRDLHLTLPLNPITQAGATADNYSWGTNYKVFKIIIPLSDTITYSGTTAVVGSIADTAYHVIACAMSTTGAPAIQYSSRFRWIG